MDIHVRKKTGQEDLSLNAKYISIWQVAHTSLQAAQSLLFYS